MTGGGYHLDSNDETPPSLLYSPENCKKWVDHTFSCIIFWSMLIYYLSKFDMFNKNKNT